MADARTTNPKSLLNITALVLIRADSLEVVRSSGKRRPSPDECGKYARALEKLRAAFLGNCTYFFELDSVVLRFARS
jgi:hypothetical protein